MQAIYPAIVWKKNITVSMKQHNSYVWPVYPPISTILSKIKIFSYFKKAYIGNSCLVVHRSIRTIAIGFIHNLPNRPT